MNAIERRIKRVIKLMARDFAGAVDYTLIDDGASDANYAEILDKNDKRIGVISERRLTGYMNDAEVQS